MKSKTHVFMANLLLKDLQRNVLAIPLENKDFVKGGNLRLNAEPTLKVHLKGGSFTPPGEVKDAILAHPTFFRAGSMGPDFFPDMLLGQGIIHGQNSGKWLELMFDEFLKMDRKDPDQKPVLAFLAGMMMHYSADLFGHAYVNEWARGWFPAITEFTTNKDKAQIVIRHMLVESYMDERVSRNPDPALKDMSIDIPVQFLYTCFANEENINRVIGSFGPAQQKEAKSLLEKMPLYYLIKLRDGMRKAAQSNAAGILDVLNYLSGWEKDTINAINDWFVVWKTIAGFTVDDKGETFPRCKAAFKGWADRHLALILGEPKWVKKLTDFLSIDLVAPIKWAIEIVEKEFEKMLLDLLEKATGIPSTIKDIEEYLKSPATLINKGTFFSEPKATDLLDKEFADYGTNSDTLTQQFRAFSLCLTMGKFCLMGADNLNAYLGKPVYQKPARYKSVQKLNITIGTSKKTWSGTDDNVYFDLVVKDGRTFSILLDKPGYNDFESGDTDSYAFVLPQRIRYDQITAWRLRKDYLKVSDDWRVRYVQLKNEDLGEVLAEYSVDRELKDKTPWEERLDLTSRAQAEPFPIDPSIITFLYSLDGQDKTGKNPAIYRQWEDESGVCLVPPMASSPVGLSASSITLKSCHGKYLSAQPDGKLEWNRDIADAWERIAIVTVGPNKIGLQSCHGKYLSAQPDGKLEWNRDRLDTWETWAIETIADGIALKSAHNKYLSAQPDGSAIADRDNAQGWETFKSDKPLATAPR
jgi:hypothetical protein